MKIKRPFARVLVGSHSTPYPRLSVRVRSGEITIPAQDLTVDTGAAATILAWSTARMLRIDEAALQAPRVQFFGFGGNGYGREMTVDLVLPGVGNVLTSAIVYFLEEAETVGGTFGLLGQRGFFDRMKLVHHHPSLSEPFFVLEGH